MQFVALGFRIIFLKAFLFLFFFFLGGIFFEGDILAFGGMEWSAENN